ncbi:MAG: ribonuclease PH [Acidobacteria bacterium]|nr:ribonuclease PH [Acidobacteriota bacterium]
MSVRSFQRAPDALRPFEIVPGVNRHAEGSCLVKAGDTHVLCTASIEARTPPFLQGRGEGWVTAEYGMLPRATHDRMPRDRQGKTAGRTHEIQRLIGRSLRAVVDRKVFGERSIVVDCDVLQADGGTRCASITGGFVALALAFEALRGQRVLNGYPLIDTVAAVSAGIVAGDLLLDLDYEEDAAAEVDINIVRTGGGRYVEVQGTAEEHPFGRERLVQMLDLADQGIAQLIDAQRAALGDALRGLLRPRP